jgi:hypothetical protein
MVIKHAAQANNCKIARKFINSQDKNLKVETAETEHYKFYIIIVIFMDSKRD